MKQNSLKNGPKTNEKLLQRQSQNPTQQSRWTHKNKEPVEKNSYTQKEATQLKEVNNLSRLFVPSSPVVVASRSYASVAKSGSQDKLTSIIEVEIYTKKIEKNVL